MNYKPPQTSHPTPPEPAVPTGVGAGSNRTVWGISGRARYRERKRIRRKMEREIKTEAEEDTVREMGRKFVTDGGRDRDIKEEKAKACR